MAPGPVGQAHGLVEHMVLQWCYKSLTKVLQESYKGVTRVLQEPYKGVTRVLCVDLAESGGPDVHADTPHQL
jgi:hypothetical protein